MFGLFIIEAGREPAAVLSGYEGNKPIVFATGAEAAEGAKHCAAGDMFTTMGWAEFKCQPRRLSSGAWKTRELSRFTDGTYVPLPWVDLPKLSLTAEHFAHVSTVDGARIAYTQDAAKGAGDIQTRVRPGRYLTQFYGDIFDAPTIAKMAAEFDRDFGEANELLFADTEEDIERVYVGGPRSCMSYAANHFDSPMHPCRVYAAGDLAVAYMVRDGEITARALCWPEKKLYGRVYGDETRLCDLLESASFSSGSLDGARMLRIEHGNGFVVPYIDGACSCSDDGMHLILGGRGICGDNQNGLSGSSMTCSDCDSPIDEADCRSDDSGNNYCDDCYNERYSNCERYNEECDADTVQEVICNSRYDGRTTQYWGERAIENEAFECEGSGKWYANEFRVELADGTVWSQDYFEDHGAVCEGNSECYSMDDMVQLEDGTAWSQDYFEDNGVTVDGKLYAKGDEPQTDEPEEDAGDLGETAAAVERTYVYRWQASPTFSCDAQLSLPMVLSNYWIAALGPDNGFDIMRGTTVVEHWNGRRYADRALAGYRAMETASLQVAA